MVFGNQQAKYFNPCTISLVSELFFLGTVTKNLVPVWNCILSCSIVQIRKYYMRNLSELVIVKSPVLARL